MQDQEILKTVPEPTLRRLPAYCNYLRRLSQHEGQVFVSCSQIGRELALDPTQVRKDLAVTGIVGRPKVGYPTRELFDVIEEFLGWRDAQNVFLAGAGSLGTALLGYKSFDQYGIRIVAAFDSDPKKVNTEVHGVPVFALEKLPNLADRMKIHLGVLTVPAETAQTVCDVMIASGIRAIWNFAPTALRVPESIIVQNEHLFSSLAILSSKLVRALREEAHV